jgi:hypothetical protein
MNSSDTVAADFSAPGPTSVTSLNTYSFGTHTPEALSRTSGNLSITILRRKDAAELPVNPASFLSRAS